LLPRGGKEGENSREFPARETPLIEGETTPGGGRPRSTLFQRGGRKEEKRGGRKASFSRPLSRGKKFTFTLPDKERRKGWHWKGRKKRKLKIARSC